VANNGPSVGSIVDDDWFGRHEPMKRILTSILALGIFSMPIVGLVGCSDETKVEEKKTIKTPEGTSTTTTTEKTDTSGSNPPPAPK
jgi:hypothetical protein